MVIQEHIGYDHRQWNAKLEPNRNACFALGSEFLCVLRLFAGLSKP